MSQSVTLELESFLSGIYEIRALYEVQRVDYAREVIRFESPSLISPGLSGPGVRNLLST